MFWITQSIMCTQTLNLLANASHNITTWVPVESHKYSDWNPGVFWNGQHKATIHSTAEHSNSSFFAGNYSTISNRTTSTIKSVLNIPNLVSYILLDIHTNLEAVCLWKNLNSKYAGL
jgi:hypothetical protein